MWTETHAVPVKQSLRSRCYVAIARLSARLPAVRGRTRLFLELHRLLSIKDQSILVRTRLSRPVSYEAVLDLHSWAQRIAFLTGAYEAETVLFLLRLLEADGRDGVLLDIGANVGLIAIPFAKSSVGTPPRVIAVEPVPDNVAALTRNVSLNLLEQQVKIVAAALGDRRKSASIQVEGNLVAGQGSGTANVLPEGSTYECVRQQLEIDTLDAKCDAGEIPPRCTVVKIDTDGYDLNILRGATEFLRRERPVIFGEFAAQCLSWHGQSLADVVAFASSEGFETWMRQGAGWRFTKRLEQSLYSRDLLLVPRESVQRFEWCLG